MTAASRDVHPGGGATGRGWARHLPAAGAAVAAATAAVGLVTNLTGGNLGAAYAPFYVQVAPRASIFLVPALAAFGLGLAAARGLAMPSVRPSAFAAGAFVLTLGLRLALNAVRDGPRAWDAVFGTAYEARNEYLPALPALRPGAGRFLEHFAQLAPGLPIHPSAHPPGMVLTLHLLGVRTAPAMAALTIGVGALSAPLVYALGRSLLDDGRARTATLLLAFAPSALLYGATSADALFATLGTAAAAALVAGRRGLRGLGAALLALASFFSYALVGAGAWAVLVTARREGVWRAVALGALCAGALAAAYLGLHAATGFDLPDALAAANGAYRRSIASERPYLFWLFGSPTAFFVALGLPVAWLVLHGASRGQTTALAVLAVVAAASLLGFTKGETERIWQFLVPLACIAAAAERPRASTPLLLALAGQALAVELLLDTRW